MNILGIETATDNCSVALSVDGEMRVLSKLLPRQQAQQLLPMIDELMASSGLARSQLDAMAFGQGPGSFTGLRVAAASCQGIALALDLPVVGISTLAAIAHQRYRLQGLEHCLACIDARMSEVYWGFYQTTSIGLSTALCPDAITAPADVAIPVERLQTSDWAISGNASSLLADNNQVLSAAATAMTESLPQAEDVLWLALPKVHQGDVMSAEQAIPVYLRDKVALTERERRSR